MNARAAFGLSVGRGFEPETSDLLITPAADNAERGVNVGLIYKYLKHWSHKGRSHGDKHGRVSYLDKYLYYLLLVIYNNSDHPGFL